MQVSVEAGQGLAREMRVDLPADDIEAEIDKRLQQFARSARIPGFRPGKVPIRVLRQQYGDRVRGEVFGEMVQESFPRALEQEDLKPAGMPNIEPDIDVKARSYAYWARFEVLPSIELQSFAGKTIKRPVTEVTDEDVEHMIERLREQRKTWRAVERGAEQGDQVLVSFKGRVDGEPFEGGTAEQFLIELGAKTMIPGFEEQLLGATAGEQRCFEVRFPQEYHAKHLAGREASFEVEIHAVNEPELPVVDADFIAAIGVGSGEIADFRADVRESMERQLRQRITDRLKDQVMDALVDNNPLELPQSLITQEALSLRKSLGNSLGGQQNMTFPDSFYVGIAQRRVATGLLVGEAIEHYGLEVTDEAVREKVAEIAAVYEQPQEVVSYYLGNEERLSQVRSLLLEERLVDHLLREAQVEDEPMSFFDLTSPS